MCCARTCAAFCYVVVGIALLIPLHAACFAADVELPEACRGCPRESLVVIYASEPLVLSSCALKTDLRELLCLSVGSGADWWRLLAVQGGCRLWR